MLFAENHRKSISLSFFYISSIPYGAWVLTGFRTPTFMLSYRQYESVRMALIRINFPNRPSPLRWFA